MALWEWLIWFRCHFLGNGELVVLAFLGKGNIIKEKRISGFPGGSVVENPPATAGDMGSSPGPGRSYMPRSS